jgi:DNA-binding NarL/FixJ family response regulator
VRPGERSTRNGRRRDVAAAELVISGRTVERDRQNILDKLGMSDRVELTRYAIRRGLQP